MERVKERSQRQREGRKGQRDKRKADEVWGQIKEGQGGVPVRWREKGDGVMNGGSEGEIGTERAERE